MLNLPKPFNSGLGKWMRKSARPLGGMDSLNPHHWRGKWLHHHGGGVCWLFVLLWIDSWRHELIVCKKWYKNNLKMRSTVLLSDPPSCTPYLLHTWEYIHGCKFNYFPQNSKINPYYESTNNYWSCGLPGSVHSFHLLCLDENCYATTIGGDYVWFQRWRWEYDTHSMHWEYHTLSAARWEYDTLSAACWEHDTLSAVILVSVTVTTVTINFAIAVAINTAIRSRIMSLITLIFC